MKQLIFLLLSVLMLLAVTACCEKKTVPKTQPIENTQNSLTEETSDESIPETPVLLYNNPGRVGYTMSAKLVEELAHNVPNIVGMKDTSGDITQTAEFIRRTRAVVTDTL